MSIKRDYLHIKEYKKRLFNYIFNYFISLIILFIYNNMFYYYQYLRFAIVNKVHTINKYVLNKNMNILLNERRKLRNYLNIKK